LPEKMSACGASWGVADAPLARGRTDDDADGRALLDEHLVIGTRRHAHLEGAGGVVRPGDVRVVEARDVVAGVARDDGDLGLAGIRDLAYAAAVLEVVDLARGEARRLARARRDADVAGEALLEAVTRVAVAARAGAGPRRDFVRVRDGAEVVGAGLPLLDDALEAVAGRHAASGQVSAVHRCKT
jgi:hypothetical protein